MNHTTATTDAPLTVTITREQIECWARRPLTDDEIARLDTCIPNSSIPAAIAEIVTQFDRDPDPDRYRFNNHSNDLGDWCPWSDTPVTAPDDSRCPAGCPSSTVTADHEDQDDADPPNNTDCQLCGAPGGFPYCTGRFGRTASCAEVIELDGLSPTGR